MKRFAIIAIVVLLIVSATSVTVIPARAEVKPVPVMRPRAALVDNLVAYWKLDEASGTRNDSVGTNHLTSNNNVGQATGKLNYAADFVAANSQYLSIADNASLSTGDIDFTLSVWIYSSLPATDPIIIDKGTIGAPWAEEYQLRLVSNKPRLLVDPTGSSAGSVTWGSALSASTWYHIVAWHDSANNLLGITVNNGAPVTSAFSSVGVDLNYQFAIGAYTGTGAYWDGKIDSVGFWKSAAGGGGVLTQAKRDLLWNGGAGCDYPFTSCEATATPTATNTPLPATATNTPLPATATFTSTPTSTWTPNWQHGFDLPPNNSLILEYRATVGDISVAIVGAFLLLVFSLYSLSRMFGPWGR